jgi:hypothetical protein
MPQDVDLTRIQFMKIQPKVKTKCCTSTAVFARTARMCRACFMLKSISNPIQAENGLAGGVGKGLSD